MTFIVLAGIVTALFVVLGSVGWLMESRSSTVVRTSAPDSEIVIVDLTAIKAPRLASATPSIRNPVPIVRVPPPHRVH